MALNRSLTDEPFYSASDLWAFGEAVYAIAQTHYREQVCDPMAALEEALEEILDDTEAE